MQSIEIKIEAFGAIERLLPKALAFEVATNQKIDELLTQIVTIYPASNQAMEKCACAIGADIVTRQTTLTQSCTLVLLSPVAGG